MNPRSALTFCALSAVALWGVSLSAHAAPGNLIKSTTTMKMVGMPNMPGPRTFSHTQCVSAKKPDISDMLKKNKNCNISNLKHNGQQYSYDMACQQGNTKTNGHATFTVADDGSYHGAMHMTANTGGSLIIKTDMTMVGKRIGGCQYTPSKHGG